MLPKLACCRCRSSPRCSKPLRHATLIKHFISHENIESFKIWECIGYPLVWSWKINGKSIKGTLFFSLGKCISLSAVGAFIGITDTKIGIKKCSNFKKCIYAYKIVCYSCPIYKYNFDAMLMLMCSKCTHISWRVYMLKRLCH